MKRRKKIIVFLLAVVAAIFLAMVITNTGIGSRISLPNVYDVNAIEFYQIENRSQSATVRTTEPRDIEVIMSALSTARQTSFTWYSAANEVPFQANYLRVYIYSDTGVMNRRLSLYGGNTVYVEYKGIYRINSTKYEEIFQIFEGLTE